MGAAWLWCLAWLSRWSPRKRRAIAKRRLSDLLRTEGLSKVGADRVVATYFSNRGAP